MSNNEKLIAEARAIAPGVALSALDLIPDGEQQHGCIISDGAATKAGVVSAFRLLYRLADALEAADKVNTSIDDAREAWSDAPEILATASRFTKPDHLTRLVVLMMTTWGEKDPRSSVAQHPVSYVATFVDMARAILATHPEPQSEPSDEQVNAFIRAINAEGSVLRGEVARVGLRAAGSVR